MRLLGIALLAFLLIGATALLSGSEWGRRIGALVEGSERPGDLEFERAPEPAPIGEFGARMELAGGGAPIVLTGLPSWQTASFHLPVDARPLSGVIHLEATAQVLNGVEAVLRVSIGGTRRADILLRPGLQRQVFEIELAAQDLGARILEVSFSLQGQGPDQACARDDGREVVVEIEQTSFLYLSLDQQIETPRDLVAMWGGNLRIGRVAGREFRTEVLQNAASLIAAG